MQEPNAKELLVTLPRLLLETLSNVLWVQLGVLEVHGAYLVKMPGSCKGGGDDVRYDYGYNYIKRAVYVCR